MKIRCPRPLDDGSARSSAGQDGKHANRQLAGASGRRMISLAPSGTSEVGSSARWRGAAWPGGPAVAWCPTRSLAWWSGLVGLPGRSRWGRAGIAAYRCLNAGSALELAERSSVADRVFDARDCQQSLCRSRERSGTISADGASSRTVPGMSGR